MSRSDAIFALGYGSSERDTAVIEGEFDAAKAVPEPATSSSLDRLCEWLDLPRIGIVDVREAARRGIQRPEKLDALVLDRVASPRDAAYWQTTLEALWKTPVIGWLDEATALRALCGALPFGANPSQELCTALGSRILPTLRLDRLRQIARRTVSLAFEAQSWLPRPDKRTFRIAVAIDRLYCGYYPETLDLLEATGAEICDFSPLRSEAIPDGADIVYFGCGHPERAPELLSANHCLKQSLRTFAAGGGRVYAEGSGLAYLCREMELPSGQSIAMTGLLPATARWLGQLASEPAQITFGASSWLAPSAVALRGYRHRGWQIEPRGAMITYAQDAGQRLDVLGRGNIIASRILVNLAANRHLLRRFLDASAPVAAATRRGPP